MSGTRCAVHGCNNTYQKNKSGERKIILHVFPKSKDLVSQTNRNEWVNRCSRKEKFNPDTSRICSDHFVETDYKRDLQNELLGLPLRRILKKTAIPTIGISNKLPHKSKSVSDCDEIHAKSESVSDCDEIHAKIKQELDELIATESESVLSISDENPLCTKNPMNAENKIDEVYLRSEENCGKSPLLQENSILEKHLILQGSSLSMPSTSEISQPAENPMEYQNYEEKYLKLLKEHLNLKSKFSHMKETVSKKIKRLNDQVRYFKAKSDRSPKVDKAEVNARHLLKKFLTDNQIALLSNKKKRVNWTEEEISVAFTIRYYSKKCYFYLRNKLHYPLPSLSTLRKFVYILDSQVAISDFDGSDVEIQT